MAWLECALDGGFPGFCVELGEVLGGQRREGGDNTFARKLGWVLVHTHWCLQRHLAFAELKLQQLSNKIHMSLALLGCNSQR
jgi:hypothetical protein